MSARTWEVAIRTMGSSTDSLTVNIPAPIARVLRERGMWRAVLTITEEGLLYKPYVAEAPGRGRIRESEVIDLPEWSHERL